MNFLWLPQPLWFTPIYSYILTQSGEVFYVSLVLCMRGIACLLWMQMMPWWMSFIDHSLLGVIDRRRWTGSHMSQSIPPLPLNGVPNPYAAGGWFGKYKMHAKNMKLIPGTLVFIGESSARAFQWIPTWQGLDDFQKSLHPCAFGQK